MSPRPRAVRLVLAVALLTASGARAQSAPGPAPQSPDPAPDSAPDPAPDSAPDPAPDSAHEGASEPAAEPPWVTPLITGVRAALEGRRAPAIEALSRARILAPTEPRLDVAFGTAALLLGDSGRAVEALAAIPSAAAYHAMAEARGQRGGLARARGILAGASSAVKARPGTLFLAALAFKAQGQPDRADQLLVRALEASGSALDEAFAPDLAIGLVRAAVGVLEAHGASRQHALLLAEALADAGRGAEARRIAEGLVSDAEVASGAHRLLARTASRLERRRALEEVELALDGEPDHRPSQVRRVELLLALPDVERARAAAETLRAVTGPARAASLRVRARLALEPGGNTAEALDLAEEAARADVASHEGLALLVRALTAAGRLDRAAAHAEALLAKRPTEVDPYALLVAIAEARGDERSARIQRLRSQAFALEARRVEREVLRREEVLAAVRDAEKGLGVAPLEAARRDHPLWALPIDLALARLGSPGVKRAARDRVLASCAPRLAEWLRRTTTFETVDVAVAYHGLPTRRLVPLSAADPARCVDIPKRSR